MTISDIQTFAECLAEHCGSCKNTKPGWRSQGCLKPDCPFYAVRLLKERLDRSPKEFERVLAYSK